jgi:hypothetical protein
MYSAAGLGYCKDLPTASSCAAGTYFLSLTCLPCPAKSWSLAGTGVCTANTGYYNMGDNTIAYYAFNPDNLLADVSGISGALTNVGGVSYAPDSASSPLTGWYAGSQNVAYFSSSYLRMPAWTIPPAFAICVWYFPTFAHGQNCPVFDFETASRLDGIILYQGGAQGNTAIDVFTSSNSFGHVIQPNAWVLNQWTHSCLSVSGNSLQTFVNGAASASTTLPGVRAAVSFPAGVGLIGNTYLVANEYRGYIDDIRIFNRSITALEAMAIYSFRDDANTTFLPVACCPAGQYATSNCTAAGATCGVCSSCGTGTYQSSPCTVFSDTVCSPCSLCTPGVTFQSKACTNLSNAVCSSRASVTQPAGYFDLGYNLIAYYSFNDPSNFLADLSGMTGNLANVGSVAYANNSASAPLRGWAGDQNVAYFSQPGGPSDAGNSKLQYLAMPKLVLGSSFSVCAWYFPSSVANPAYATVFDLGNGYPGNNVWLMRALVGSNVLAVLYPTSAENGFMMNGGWVSNTWNHVCLAVSGVTAKGYLNGVAAGSGTLAASYPQPLYYGEGGGYIGRSHLGGYQYQMFFGYIDELRLFNRSITAAEAAQVYSYRGPTNTSYLWAKCSDCSIGYYLTASCTPISDTVCAACSVCPAGKFISAPCSGSVDVVCSSCSSCVSGRTYRKAPCTSYANTVCANCTSCSLYTISACTDMADAVCLECPAGTYLVAGACVNCPAGYYAGVANSKVCLPCGVGTYAPNQGASSCLQCPANSYCSSSFAMPCPEGMFSEAGSGTCVEISTSVILGTATPPDTALPNTVDLVIVNTTSVHIMAYSTNSRVEISESHYAVCTNLSFYVQGFCTVLQQANPTDTFICQATSLDDQLCPCECHNASGRRLLFTVSSHVLINSRHEMGTVQAPDVTPPWMLRVEIQETCPESGCDSGSSISVAGLVGGVVAGVLLFCCFAASIVYCIFMHSRESEKKIINQEIKRKQ